MSSINRQIITAAINVTENDAYSVGDIAAAMLHVMRREEDWTAEFVREVMITVIFVVSTDDNDEYADVAAIIIEAARAIMAGAARAEDEHGWVDVDDIEVAFETVQSDDESDEVEGDGIRCGICGADVSDTEDGWCTCLDVKTTADKDFSYDIA